MIKGKAIKDFRIGPQLILRGHLCEVPPDYAHMVDAVEEEVEKIVEKLDEVKVQAKEKVAKKTAAKRKTSSSRTEK